MIPSQHFKHLHEMNTALQSAWMRLVVARQSGNPKEINHATQEYLQLLQLTYNAAQLAVSGQ